MLNSTTVELSADDLQPECLQRELPDSRKFVSAHHRGDFRGAEETHWTSNAATPPFEKKKKKRLMFQNILQGGGFNYFLFLLIPVEII